MIEFGEYLPDIAPLENPGCISVVNLLPGHPGYLPVPSPLNFSSNKLNGIPLGYFSCNDNETPSVPYTFFGTATKLYQTTGNSFTDVSRTVSYNTATVNHWEFAQWGEQVVATNFDDNPQVITLGSTPFQDLTGAPPRAKHIASVQDFLVLGNTQDVSGTATPQRVQWCALNNITSWTVSATTQADYQDLNNNGGAIQKVVSGEYGLIIQERAITRMSYIGAPEVFQFDLLEGNRGCIAPQSVVKIGNNVAYLAEDGFYVFDGQQSIPISDNKVEDTFFADVNPNYYYRISVALWPRENIIAWSYVSNNTLVAGMPDSILFYNYSPSSKTRWSFANIYTYILANPISTAYTLDGLDAVSTNLDALPNPPPNDISLDSPIWAGLLPYMGIISEDFTLQTLSGVALDAEIDTGEGWLKQPDRTLVSLIRPHIDACTGTVTAQIGSRNLESEAISYGPITTLNSSGNIPVRANARFLSLRLNITGNFNQAQGFDIIQSSKVGIR